MNTDTQRERIAFLVRVIAKEADCLMITDARLFDPVFTIEQYDSLGANIDLAERLDAFVSRFGRLQDSIGDKLLPALMAVAGEPKAPAIDNLEKAEQFGWLDSVDNWLTMRRLRNQMVHEYIEDSKVLLDALNVAHEFVPVLVECSKRFISEANRR
jgi:hypothetical protein